MEAPSLPTHPRKETAAAGSKNRALMCRRPFFACVCPRRSTPVGRAFFFGSRSVGSSPPSLCRHSRSVFTTFLSFSHILPLRPRARARRRRGGNSQSTGNENRIGGRGRRGEEEGDDVNRRAPKEEGGRVEAAKYMGRAILCSRSEIAG